MFDIQIIFEVDIFALKVFKKMLINENITFLFIICVNIYSSLTFMFYVVGQRLLFRSYQYY